MKREKLRPREGQEGEERVDAQEGADEEKGA